MKKVLFASVDIEADGPSTFDSNMVELGISFFTTDEYDSYKEVDSFYSTVKQIPGKNGDADTIQWLKDNKVYERAINEFSVEPSEVFNKLAMKLNELSKEYNIQWVAYPSAYDWQWINYYWYRFVDKSVLTDVNYIYRHPYSAKCISTLFSNYCSINNINNKQDKEKLWKTLSQNKEHTHNALDDAIEQGIGFFNLNVRMKSEKNINSN